MAMYWVTESLPLPITGMIPIVLYPLMGILSTGDTCDAYINDTTIMFLGSLIIAVVIENSGLHMRVALLIIKFIGCSHRKYEYFCGPEVNRQIIIFEFFFQRIFSN